FINNFNDKMKSISNTFLLMNEYAEAGMMLDSVLGTIKDDLKFDKIIKLDKSHLDFHLFLSKIKYQKYLASHFVFEPKRKEIQRIPKYYFESAIWKRLVAESKCYSSLQLLDDPNSSLYLQDTDRRDLEITYLINKLSQKTSGSKLKIFNKLFILKNDMLDVKKKKILNQDVYDFLTPWKERFDELKITDGKVLLKIVKFSDAQGAIGGNNLRDIGIFDNILGIQSITASDDSEFSGNTMIFDFSLDEAEVKNCQNDYNAIFKRAINISDFFV
ncbi:MAG: hypothetical protein JZU65_14585, partial [Chlorobium sp.]|nr:hypothetical protein [Chlorobium sp.]